MGGFDHGPAAHGSTQTAAVSARNARYGMVLFLVYLVLYVGFVLINTFRPAVMDMVLAAGVNLAIWYGFGLIAAALILALVYAWLCRAGQAAHGDAGQVARGDAAQGGRGEVGP